MFCLYSIHHSKRKQESHTGCTPQRTSWCILSSSPRDVSSRGLAMVQLTPPANPLPVLSLLRTGFCSLVLAVSEQLKDVHFDLGLAQPLRSAVDAVLGQGDGQPLPSAAFHGVVQDSSCGQATTWRQLVHHLLLLLSSFPNLPPTTSSISRQILESLHLSTIPKASAPQASRALFAGR